MNDISHYAICDRRPSPRREALLTALHRAEREFTSACAWRMHIRDVAEMSGCTSAAFRRCNRAHAAYFAARERLDDWDYRQTPEAAAEREYRARVWAEEAINGQWPRFKTCDNCGGEGGFELHEYRSKWSRDPYGGQWLGCQECGGTGLVEGEAEPLTQCDLAERCGEHKQ